MPAFAAIAGLWLAGEVARADVDPVIARGQQVYARACEPCHGVNGDGNGIAARELAPKPRDFTAGVYKFRTTRSGSIPTTDDLRRTVAAGIPGTSMPAWKGLLSEADRDAVIAYLETLSPVFAEGLYPDDVIVDRAVAVPPTTDAMIATGAAEYVSMQCAKCHGPDGRGNRANPLVDDKGRKIVAFDFTRGTYKGGSAPADVYRAFTTGLDGTPMPSYGDSLAEDERWALVAYVESLRRPAGPIHWLLHPPTAASPRPRSP